MSQEVPLEIVEFSPDQTDELVAMWRASFEHGVGITDPHPIEEQRDFLLNELAPNHEIRVALANGQIAGFIAASPESISALYVHVDHLGRGIGTQLLEWAKNRSEDGKLWLHTFESNLVAQRFYEKNGFTLIERGFEEHWQLADIKYEWSSRQP